MTFKYYMAYLAIVFIATITPGPSMLLAVNHGANHGVKRTLYSGLGNMAGNLLMALVSLMGLGMILLASGFVFSVIKWTGVAYLVYAGLRMIFDSAIPDRAGAIKTPGSIRRSRSLFSEGFIIAIGNPKGILFFTALFPQFIDIHKNAWLDFIIVFLTLGFIAFGCYMLYAAAGMRLNSLFSRYSFRKIFNRICGAFFIATGCAIAVTDSRN